MVLEMNHNHRISTCTNLLECDDGYEAQSQADYDYLCTENHSALMWAAMSPVGNVGGLIHGVQIYRSC
jgi:hypothetical protein